MSVLAEQTPRFLFVGERRSHRAIAMNVTWLDGKLAAKVLHEALRACAIEPATCEYVNLWYDGDAWVLNGEVLLTIRAYAAAGIPVVAMGRRVQATLQRAGVPFRSLTHPAARGSIRRTERYRAHVAEVLGAE